jgi:hypothetical protein
MRAEENTQHSLSDLFWNWEALCRFGGPARAGTDNARKSKMESRSHVHNIGAHMCVGRSIGMTEHA